MWVGPRAELRSAPQPMETSGTALPRRPGVYVHVVWPTFPHFHGVPLESPAPLRAWTAWTALPPPLVHVGQPVNDPGEIHAARREGRLTREKSYDPLDFTLAFVDRDDDLDFLCEGFNSPRALMSCGHAVTPMSLTNWCLRQLDQGETRFVCGQHGCNVEWSYEEVCKMALLTPEEMQYFERAVAYNAAMHNSKSCPGCKLPVVRQNEFDLRVGCTVCTANRRCIFDFCWQCLREWKGPAPRLDRCDNDGCTNESLKTLASCPDTIIESAFCPSIRACPTCGLLLQHDNQSCRDVICPRCKVEFCFVCLKLSDECYTEEDYMCSSSVAPRQTSIPVWQRK